MVFPLSISNDNATAGWDGYTYDHISTISGYEIYELNAATYTQIKVSTDSLAADYNQWSDHDLTGNPTSVVDNGTVVTLSANVLLFEFTKPTVASWISTGSPPRMQESDV